MEKRFCDKCSREIKDYNCLGRIYITKYNHGDDEKEDNYTEFDLCLKCLEIADKWVKEFISFPIDRKYLLSQDELEKL